MSTPRQSRADRRRATEVRILDSARELFAEKGFERTTIRAVATAASVDPALVMQYFGSKRELFSQAVQALPAPLTATDATDADELVDQLLASLGLKLGGLPEGTLAMMRSMLTDQAAADHVRASLGRQIDSVGAALPASEDSELRAALVVTALLGVTIGHQLLGLAVLREAPADQIAALLRPAIKALAGPPCDPSAPSLGK
ncbi:TetR/AcrR family transcriptional regulator [Streptomyces gilvifuscus]|uniref:TetR family transcriptional regulator n=1 Tax=Streptomyces gilvifuscus TaxID=1550617 RepID=A0ABT5FP84_9ACTN|nr:TetR/AcrR family transcriptional regulator [Streptomyces gilvifuscus]MDC2954298.1 TetR family transcriptional regulator [Streptomyces gilvifuscus]